MPKSRSDVLSQQNRERVARRIRAAIADSGLSQTEVASRVGVEPSAVNAWYWGEKIPGLENLLRLAEATGVRAAFLLADRLPRQDSIEGLGVDLGATLGRKRVRALLSASEDALREEIDHAIGRLHGRGELETADKPKRRRPSS